MSNEPDQEVVNETQSPQQKFWRKHWWWAIPCYIFTATIWLGVETLFMFQNIPLLAATIFFVAGLILIEKLLTWRFGRPKPRTWKAARIALIHVVVFLIYIVTIAFVMRYYVPTTVISEKTTYITQPLTPDGLEIDVIGAITERFSPKCKPDENGFRYVVERFGIKSFLERNDSLDLQKDISNTIIKQLEISNTEQTVTYQPIIEYFIERFENTDKENTSEQKTTQEDQKSVPLETRARNAISLLFQKSWNANTVIDGVSITDTIHWLEVNGDALDEFGKAVRFPVYYAPMLTSQNDVPISLIPNYEYSFHKGIVRGLRIRIMYSLGIGDFKKAKYDTMTIIKLADMQMRYFGTNTEFLAAVSMLGYGKYAMLDLIRFGNLTKQQLEQLQLDLQQYRTMPDWDDLMFIIRMQNIDSLYRFGNLRVDLNTDPNTKNNLTPFEIEMVRWEFSMLKYFGWTQEFTKQQVRLDHLEKLLGNGFSRKQLTAFNEQCEKKNRLFDPDNPFYKILMLFFWKGHYLLFPTIIGEIASTFNDATNIISSRYSLETLERLFDIAFALELYRHDHGQYPASLKELAGKYIEKIPNDPYTDGEPFHYSPESQPNTGYLLYSVGTNGNDDNGIGWGYGDCNKKQELPTDNETDNKNLTDPKQSDKPPKSGDDIRIRMSCGEPTPCGC